MLDKVIISHVNKNGVKKEFEADFNLLSREQYLKYIEYQLTYEGEPDGSWTTPRFQWGDEKLVFKIDTTIMPKSKDEKYMKDQAKVLSRTINYNTKTGEVTNIVKGNDLAEDFFVFDQS